MSELQLIQQLVQLVGPAGAVILMLGWWFIYQRDKKRDPRNDVEATATARERVARIDTHVQEIIKDVSEIKADVKAANGAFLRHLENHPK